MTCDFSLLQSLLDRQAGVPKKWRRPMAELEREIDAGMERALRASLTPTRSPGTRR